MAFTTFTAKLAPATCTLVPGMAASAVAVPVSRMSMLPIAATLPLPVMAA